MAGEMGEQVAADVAGDRDEAARGDEAADPPGKVVGHDQGAQHAERAPDGSAGAGTGGDDVDQVLQAVLGRNAAHDGGEHRDKDGEMAGRVAPRIVEQEGQRPAAQSRQIAFTKGPHRDTAPFFSLAHCRPVTRRNVATFTIYHL